MKKSLVLLLFLICLYRGHAQTALVELFYNLNNIQYSALCVFNGNSGTCNVKSSIGNCWFDVYLSQYDSYLTITMSNPSVYGWIPGVCYLSTNGNVIDFQGYRYGLGASVVKEHDWNLKKAQYGFPLDSTPFRSDQPVIVKDAPCNHRGCDCSAYHGYLSPAGIYHGKCSNSDGHGHTCNHSPEEHGLNK